MVQGISSGPDAKAIHEWADDGSFDTRLKWGENIRQTYVTDAHGLETWRYYDILGSPTAFATPTTPPSSLVGAVQSVGP